MSGVEEYNNKWKQKTENAISNSPHPSIVYDFWMNILSSKEYSSAYMYVCYVNAFLRYIDIKNVRQIKMSHYDAYMVTIKDKASSYQIAVYSALKKFSGFLAANGYTEHYMQFKDRPKFRETQKTIKKRENGYLTQEETKKVEISASLGNQFTYNRSDKWIARDYAILMVFLGSGIRCSALYKLDVDDFDVKNKTITVLEKGSKSREITIPSITVEALNDWLAWRKDMVKEGQTALFISKYGNRMSDDAISHTVKNMTKIIAGKTISPHKLRATYGTQLYNMTGDLYFVQQRMGHNNPMTTELYIRGQKENLSQKAADLMDEFMS